MSSVELSECSVGHSQHSNYADHRAPPRGHFQPVKEVLMLRLTTAERDELTAIAFDSL